MRRIFLVSARLRLSERRFSTADFLTRVGRPGRWRRLERLRQGFGESSQSRLAILQLRSLFGGGDGQNAVDQPVAKSLESAVALSIVK